MEKGEERRLDCNALADLVIQANKYLNEKGDGSIGRMQSIMVGMDKLAKAAEIATEIKKNKPDQDGQA